MTGKDDMQQNECTRNCWIAAGVVGLLVWIFASFIGSTSVMGGLFLGLIAIVLMGLFLVWALCQGSGSAADDRHHGLARAKPAARPMAAPEPMPVQSPAPAQAAAAPAAVSAAKPSVAPKPAPKPEAKPAPEPETVAAPAPKVAAKETPPAAEPAATKAEPAKPAAAEKAEPTAQAKPAPKPETKKEAQPAAKPAKAAEARPDDLKQIKGVGPKLEDLLHENGVTRFAQIAAWTDSEIDRFAEKIGSMGGRIRSDDWVTQARTLSEGGSTDFAQRVKKGDIYE